METQVNINYNQILKLIRQLPEKDIARLANTLQAEIATEKTAEFLQDLLMQAPTWSDSDYNAYVEARNLLNKSRIS